MDTIGKRPDDVLAGDPYARLGAALSALEAMEDGLIEGMAERPDDIMAQMPEWQRRCEEWRVTAEGLFGEFHDGLRSGSYLAADAARLRARLLSLIKKEERLYEAVSSQRERLAGELKALGKGRAALNGYKVFGVGRRSRFVNNG